MHQSSMMKFQAFLDVYVKAHPVTDGRSILDIGSAAYHGARTYRQPAEEAGLRYVGLDMQPGNNVDIVSEQPCVYPELETESFDFIVSGQTFEHNPFFWVSFCEMARILKQDGLLLVVAPSGGTVHRYPYDCWRYYPDSWAALCAISGLETAEVLFETDANRKLVDGGKWRDSAVVARKRAFNSAQDRATYYGLLSAIVEPFALNKYAFDPSTPNVGPVSGRYQQMVNELKSE